MMQIPVYIINLDRRSDRWMRISELLDGMRGGVTYHRISGIDSLNALDYEENELFHVRTCEAKVKKNESLPRKLKACSFSHLKAMDTFLASNCAYALILEDDAVIASDISSLCASTDWIPKNADLINLEVTHEGREILSSPKVGATPSGRVLRKFYDFQAGACAYIISRRGAKIVLSAKNRLSVPFDVLLHYPVYSKISRKLRPIQIFPAMARQLPTHEDNPSDTFNPKNDPAYCWTKLWKHKSIRHKFTRMPFRIKLCYLRLRGFAVKYILNFDTSYGA